MSPHRPWPDATGPWTPDSRSWGILRFFAAAAGGEVVCRHSLAVARQALILARALAVQEGGFFRDLEAGALLHDIGKIGIPRRILMKCGALSPFELRIVREHPLVGFELISRLEFLRGAGGVVLYHHERYDGRGYPFGLARDSIPLVARVFSLADAMDAMTSDRPYRGGRSVLEARAEIVRCRGTQFDPDVVDAFLRVPLAVWREAGQRLRPAEAAFRVN